MNTDASSRPGTNTGHGHVWDRLDGMKARCGGPSMCRECASDLATYGEKRVDRADDASSKRAELVAGLRELADFYENNPTMPMASYPDILVGISAGTDLDGIAAVQAAADRLGVPMHPPGSPSPGQRHYIATGRFGPGKDLYPTLELRVYYIPQSERESDV